MTEQEKGVKLTEIKDFFGYKSVKEFGEDWKKLSDEEKEYFKTAVAEELGRL
jgi:hypothetical protein